jgi:ABC-type Na+ efflux pump permease subunit
MRIGGLCFLISVIVLVFAAFSKFGTEQNINPNTVSMLTLLSVAVSCLGALELKIHRRHRSEQQRTANTLASALRNGVLQ